MGVPYLGCEVTVPGSLQALLIDYNVVGNVAPHGHVRIIQCRARRLQDKSSHWTRHGACQSDALGGSRGFDNNVKLLQ